MLKLKRRPLVEGWAVDVNEDDQVGSPGGRSGLADNHLAWVVTLLVVLLAAGVLLRLSGQTRKPETLIRSPKQAVAGSYTDEKHRGFEEVFSGQTTAGTRVVEAVFTDVDRFRVVLPGDANADDIDYIAKLAAMKIDREFGHGCVVSVYLRRAEDGSTIPVATTVWDKKKFGYVVRFNSEQRLL